MGLLAAAIGALYSVYATYGLARGLKPADMTFLRMGVAGLATLPSSATSFSCTSELFCPLSIVTSEWPAVCVWGSPVR